MVAELPEDVQAKFARIFECSRTEGKVVPPPEMEPWIERQFGSVDSVRTQHIVKVINKVTYEGALYNSLRSKRPMQARVSQDLEESIRESTGDPFCAPLTGTPADIFGRLKGAHSISASNVAKYDGYHGVIIFDEHHPLRLSEQRLVDYFETAMAWGREVLRVDPEAKYMFIMWNCLWKSGASIIHGHLQVTATKQQHYAKIEGLRRASERYLSEWGADYFDDLFQVHQALGLGWTWEGVRAMAYIAPVKEKEVLLISTAFDLGARLALWRLLSGYLELGVTSFNVAVYLPPVGPTAESWGHFPVIVRTVDRGDPSNRTADVGAMELYAASVISSDPFPLADALRSKF
jgi:hypothetical protein